MRDFVVVATRVAALVWEVLRVRLDGTGVADEIGVRVLASQAGRVTVAFALCPSSDVVGRRDAGVPCTRRFAARAVGDVLSAVMRRLPNFALAEDSLAYDDGAVVGGLREPRPTLGLSTRGFWTVILSAPQ
jgi:hypothetical protein